MAGKRKGRSLEDEPEVSSSSKKPAKKAADKIKIPTADDYVRILRQMKGVEEDDYAFFDDPLAWCGDVTERIPTGILALDRILGGGWPMGRIIELAAWESVGKSTIIDQSIAMAQSMSDVCALIDSERARDKAYSTSLGVDASKLVVMSSETVEDGYIAIDRFVSVQEAQMELLKQKKQQPPRLLIFWDSLGGTPTREELEGSADDTHVGVAARRNRLNMRRLAQRANRTRTTIVLANQFYENIGPFGGLKTYGGGGIRYFTSVRLWCSKKANLKIGDAVVGHIIEAKMRKTRIGVPRPPTDLGLIYGAGIHNAWSLFEWGKKHGAHPGHTWVKQSGGWTYLMLPDNTYDSTQKSFIGFADLLAARPEIYQQMSNAYLAEELVGGYDE